MTRKADVYVQCNFCPTQSIVAGRTIKEARSAAKILGWTCTGDTDTCPRCRPGAVKIDQVLFWRNAVVRVLRDAANLNYRQIGEITGLSRQRIHQIWQLSSTQEIEDWIDKTKEVFFATVTIPRLEEPEEPAEGNDHGGVDRG